MEKTATPFASLVLSLVVKPHGLLPGEVLERAALTGDDAAWQVLVDRHNHRVMVALLGLGVGIERAKELAQDTWLALLSKQRAQTLRQLELPGLAIRHACFLALDELKASRRATAFIEKTSTQTADDWEERFLVGDLAQKAAQVIQGASKSERAVFDRLIATPDLTHAELAAQTGLSVNRVKHIVCEVRRTLRRALGGGEHE